MFQTGEDGVQCIGDEASNVSLRLLIGVYCEGKVYFISLCYLFVHLGWGVD